MQPSRIACPPVIALLLVGLAVGQESGRVFDPTVGGPWNGFAVCYGPHRDGQRPGGAGPTAAQLREDLRLMRPHWQLLRIYGASGFARTLLEEIRDGAPGMRVMLGVWIAAEAERDSTGAVIRPLPEGIEANRREVAAAIELAREFPHEVISVCVGNETQVSWSPHPCDLDMLIGHVRTVQATVAQPVTAADDFGYWLLPDSRRLAREVDFVTTHAHPMWNGQRLDDALPWLKDQVSALRARHPDKPLVIGETGWATSVADHGEQARLIKGAPGEAEQSAFYQAVQAWARDEAIPTFWFEAFDENWKGGDDPAEVEKHWGMFGADRTPKDALAP